MLRVLGGLGVLRRLRVLCRLGVLRGMRVPWGLRILCGRTRRLLLIDDPDVVVEHNGLRALR